MKSFSKLFLKGLIGVEGSWDSVARTGTLNVIVAGLRIGLNLGVAIGQA